jgi:hypothetical protein
MKSSQATAMGTISLQRRISRSGELLGNSEETESEKAVDFTALAIGRSIRRKAEDIIEGLEEYFAERHVLPRKDPTDTLTE